MAIIQKERYGLIHEKNGNQQIHRRFCFSFRKRHFDLVLSPRAYFSNHRSDSDRDHRRAFLLEIQMLGKRDKSELTLKPEFFSLAKSALGGVRQAPKSSKIKA